MGVSEPRPGARQGVVLGGALAPSGPGEDSCCHPWSLDWQVCKKSPHTGCMSQSFPASWPVSCRLWSPGTGSQEMRTEQ